MYYTGCKYRRSDPIWDYCILTQKECYFEPFNCEYKRREEANDDNYDYQKSRY